MTRFDKLTESKENLARYLAENNDCLMKRRCGIEKWCTKWLRKKKEDGTLGEIVDCELVWQDWLAEEVE